jgi:hypothetical protein
MIGIILAITVSYILSVWYIKRWVKLAHSKGGRFEGLEVGGLDVVVTLFPIVNTILFIILLFSPPLISRKYRNTIRKFFRLNDHEN